MRLGLRFGFAVVSSLVSFACKSESAPPVYLDANYQLRCLDCQPRTADTPTREVATLDGESDFRLTCTVSRISGDLSMNLVALYESERSDRRYGFRITRANIDADDQSGECRVRITEGANTYEGACTAGDPTVETPCQVAFERKGAIVEGRLYCDRIPNTGNLSSYRYLVDPGTSDRAAKFEVHNCAGL